MSTLIENSRRLMLALAAAFVCGIVALTFLYGWVGVGMGGDSPYKPLLTLFGPVLALFTHMSLLLFVPICIPLVAVLFAGALKPNLWGVNAVAFGAIWLALGWWLQELF